LRRLEAICRHNLKIKLKSELLGCIKFLIYQKLE
jgi:hypothetical protein